MTTRKNLIQLLTNLLSASVGDSAFFYQILEKLLDCHVVSTSDKSELFYKIIDVVRHADLAALSGFGFSNRLIGMLAPRDNTAAVQIYQRVTAGDAARVTDMHVQILTTLHAGLDAAGHPATEPLARLIIELAIKESRVDLFESIASRHRNITSHAAIRELTTLVPRCDARIKRSNVWVRA